MQYFYLYILILLCLIIAVSYWTTINSNFVEPFNSNKQTFVLLGDSILKNDAYVSDGKSIDSLLIERTNGKTISLWARKCEIVESAPMMILGEMSTASTTIHKALEMEYLEFFKREANTLPLFNKSTK